MNTPKQIAEIFERYIALVNMPDEPQRLYAPIRYSLAEGGKRMRPVLTMLAYNIYADDIQSVLPAAAAVEVFHNFTLLHDDIMDNAMVRRSRPSVYAKYLPAVFERFNSMAAQVCEGQQYDMDFETQQKVAVAEYMNMIELKTAALLAGSVTIGATLAGASEEDVQKLHKFATEVGLAFQLQDDLLDSYGDEQLGKKIGGDILEGKKTYLMIISLSHATEEQREVLRSTHLNTNLTDEQKIAAVKAVYDAIGAKQMTEQQIAVRISRALAILDTLDVPAERLEYMKGYVESLIGRKR